MQNVEFEGSQHPEFMGAGARPGVEIWRIENKVPVQQPEKSYGKFCKGDSYLVLKTVRTSGGSFEWDLHFWLGEESSVDEMGIAAYKTVELDDSLGGAPVQYRETQGNESAKFQALFKQGITYLEGGVESGFKHVERDKYETRLFHLKGKRNVRVNQVKVSAASMNSGDVFILDAGLTLYQWNGADSNKYERAKALDVVQKIKDDERGGRARVERVDDGAESEAFWEALGGKGKVMSADEAGGDEEAEKKAAADLKLVHVTSMKKEATFGPAQQPVKHCMLESDGLIIVDTASAVFVWVGKGASKEVKSAAMTAGMQYVAQQKYPPTTPISRVAEGTETPLFKDLFSDWPRASLQVDFSKTLGSASKKNYRRQSSNAELVGGMLKQSSLTISAEDRRKSLLAEVNAFSQTVGKVEVWRIANFDMVALDPDAYGQFYSGDSYIILHSYTDDRGRDAWVIYFWLGRHSSTDEIGTAALKATELDDKYGGAPVQVRVTQNKEPLHMLRLFTGKFIVHEGGNPSSFKNVTEDVTISDGTGLYHIRGSNEFNTRAVQVDKTASALNSSDTFVLCGKDRVVVWYGKHGSKDERAAAASIAEVLRGAREWCEVEEGEEDQDFWEHLGGKTEYPEGVADEDDATAPRLFHCSNASGAFETEEILEFSQDDLQLDDVYLLDVGSTVYVWLGPDANETERRGILELAAEYIKASGREGTPVVQVKASQEPASFTCHFLGWDHAKAKVFQDPYEAKLAAMKLQDKHESAPASASGESPSLVRVSGAGDTPSPFGARVARKIPVTPAVKSPDIEGADAGGKSVSPFGPMLKRKSATPSPASKPLESSQDSGSGSPFLIKLRPTGVSLVNQADADAVQGDPLAPAAAAVSSKMVEAVDTANVSASNLPAAGKASPVADSQAAALWKDPDTTKFSYAELKAREGAVEAQVDPVKRPLYLTDAEMKEVMGCTRQEYLDMKLWKQNELRKKVALF